MRWIAGFLTGLLLAAVFGGLAAPQASAVAGYDSRYFGESAFLSLSPGQSGQFAAGFDNTGGIGWQTGTSSQVNLAVCLADKITCNVTSPNAAWAQTWFSTTAYATQSTSFVGPGQTGWFVYSVRAPSNAVVGSSVRFNGELVLAVTSEKLHPEGYYQDASVAGSTITPASIDVTPVVQTAKLGLFPTVSATVKDAAGAGIPNIIVGFEVLSDTSLNGSLFLTAITNSSGLAAITYTRNNPGTDAVTAYVASTPTLRDYATIYWTVSGASISVTPDTSVTAASDQCVTYSYTAKDPTTGANLNTVTLYLNFLENIGRTSDADGGATLVGNSTTSPTPTTGVPETTSTTGTGTFQACGNGATLTLTPILYDNQGGGLAVKYETGDSVDAGGSVTFQSRVVTLTVTPTTADDQVANTQRAFVIDALDQFDDPYTGPVRISFKELHDGDATTSTSALVAWVDADTSPTQATASGGSAPSGASDIADTDNAVIANLNADGRATFGVFAVGSATATPIVWIDSYANALPGADETQDLGGVTTWAPIELSSCALTRNKNIAAASPVADAGAFSHGDIFVIFRYVDQSGNAFDPMPDGVVTFTITRISGTLSIRAEGRTTNTTLSSGSTTTSTAFTVSDSDTTLVMDAADAASATVTASSTAGGKTVTCGPISVFWADANPEPTSGTLNGTIKQVEKGTSVLDGGGYVVQIANGQKYVVNYSNTQSFIVEGNPSDESEFEAALSVNDTILWSYGTGARSHNITIDN